MCRCGRHESSCNCYKRGAIAVRDRELTAFENGAPLRLIAESAFAWSV
jgi:hypothetical protein